MNQPKKNSLKVPKVAEPLNNKYVITKLWGLCNTHVGAVIYSSSGYLIPIITLTS